MKYLYIIILILTALSCDIKKSDMEADINFTKVFSDNHELFAYFPTDIVETEDGGFLILSGLYDSEALNYPKVHLTKTDAFGTVEWATSPDGAPLSPTRSIASLNGNYYVFCMEDDLDCQIYQIVIGESSGNLIHVKEINSKNPLAVYQDSSDNFVLLGFDIIGNKTLFQKLNSSFDEQWSVSMNAYLGSSYFVRYHLNKEDEEMPFYIGSANGQYYINCFLQTGLSVAFVNPENGNLLGSIMGNSDEFNIDAAYSSLVYLNENSFALARFHNSENYIHPSIEIDPNGNMHSSQLGNDYIYLPELSGNAKVVSMKDQFVDDELLLFASTSKTNQIVLYFFDPENSELVKTHYLGHTNPVEIAAVKRSSDGALIILGKTWVAGRFQRIILYKVSMEELGFEDDNS